VLLAGANAAQSLLIARTLEIEGCEVSHFVGGGEAVEALIAATPDLILINAPLSDSSAASLVRWVRMRPQTADVPCMAIVAGDQSHLAARLYDAGADLVITRPTELDLLARRVAAVLSRRQLKLAS
jgi:DNA-binding response OmpR family regulator